MTILEAFTFIERVNANMNDQIADINVLEKQELARVRAKYGQELSEFIEKWNGDPLNRDRTYRVFTELQEAKE